MVRIGRDRRRRDAAWFSPELQVVVYAKNSDPRTGDTIYRLANLKRGEPPAELFKVPAGNRLRQP